MKWKRKMYIDKSLFFEKFNKIDYPPRTLTHTQDLSRREYKLSVSGIKWMLSLDILQTLFIF